LELHEEEKLHLLTLPTLRFDTAQVVYRLVDADHMIAYGDLAAIRASIQSMLRPKDAQEQIAMLRARYAELGPQGSEYFDGLFKKCRNGKNEAQRVLTLLHAYPLADVIAAIGRSIQYHAYGFHSLERILTHFGTQRNSWETLTEHEQQMLKQITESDPIGPRRSEEYQQLLDELTAKTDEAPEQPKSTGSDPSCETSSEEFDTASGDEPPRQDPAAPGEPEAEDAS